MSPMPDMSGDRCDRCGKRLTVAAVFCPRCGNRVRDFARVADEDDNAEIAAIVEETAAATTAVGSRPSPRPSPSIPPSRVPPYRYPATPPPPLAARPPKKKTGLWPLLVVAFIALRAVSVVSRSPSYTPPAPPMPPPPPVSRIYVPPPSAPQFPSRTLPRTFPNRTHSAR